jgi:Flp pilus assembly protein TadD
MDDWRLIQTDNPLANGQLTPLSIWFQTGFPLSDLGLRLEGTAWGENPLYYHLINITLHAASAVLVWRVLARLQVRGAWLAGLLFAIHPVCVNSVARIAELKNTLSLPFFLASLLCYFQYETSILYRNEPSIRERRLGTIFYVFSLLAFVLALFAKTSTVVLPMILCACAVWRRGSLSQRDLVHCAPHFILAFSFGIMSVWFQKFQALAGQTLPPTSLLERVLIVPHVFLFYLGKAFLPLNLSIVYPRWSMDFYSLDAWLPWIFISTGALVCLKFRRSWGRHALFGLVSFGILLFPVLGLFDAQYLTRWQVSDHLEYLPLIAPIALASAALVWLPKAVGLLKINLRFAGEALLGCVAKPDVSRHELQSPSISRSKIHWFFITGSLAVSFALTFERAAAFSTPEKLMRDTLVKNPLASDAHNDLGAILMRRNDLTGARNEFDAAVRTDPNNIVAQSNLAFVMALQGRLPEAKSRFQAILRAKPFDAETHLRMANVCKTERKCRSARYHLQMALRLKPSTETRLQLAQLCYETGQPREAVAQFRELLRLKPDSAEGLNNLAWLLATCGDERVRDGGEAVRCAKQACKLTEFKESIFMSTLAAAYAESGRFPLAVGMAEKALRLQITADQPGLVELNRQLLMQYRAGKAYHQQVTSPDSND